MAATKCKSKVKATSATKRKSSAKAAKASRKAVKSKSTAKSREKLQPSTWTASGYEVTRSKRKTEIPMKTNVGYTVRKGYTYNVTRPDGSKLGRKAYSREDAEKIVGEDRKAKAGRR
ncbi:MAG: hypothetical protein Q4Q58_06710 [Thermoplasmata archaeon]|nr:hypothetical protein [Thermoplasmata archaeon]